MKPLYDDQGVMRCWQITEGMRLVVISTGQIFEIGSRDNLRCGTLGVEDPLTLKIVGTIPIPVDNSLRNKAMVREIDKIGNPLSDWSLWCFDTILPKDRYLFSE